MSGAGASTTELDGSYPTHYPTTVPDPLPMGFVYVVIRDRELTAEFIDSDGTSLFTRTITR